MTKSITLRSVGQLSFIAACNINLTGRLNYHGKTFEVVREGNGPFKMLITHDAVDSDSLEPADTIRQALVRAANNGTAGSVAGDPANRSSLDNAEFEGCDFSGQSLARRQFNNVRFIDCTFIDTDLTDSTFSQCTFGLCRFSDGKRNARLNRSSFQGCGFFDVNAQDADFSEAKFVHCHLGEVAAVRARLVSATFENCTLTGVKLDHANISDAEFSVCLASDVNFTGANISGAVFSRFGDSGAPGDESRISFCYTTMRHTRFYDCKLSGADFQEAKFSGAEMIGTALGGAKFTPWSCNHLFLDETAHSTLPVASGARRIPLLDSAWERYRDHVCPSSPPVGSKGKTPHQDAEESVTGRRSWPDRLAELLDWLSCAEPVRPGSILAMEQSQTPNSTSDQDSGFFAYLLATDLERSSTPRCSFSSSDSFSSSIPSIPSGSPSKATIRPDRMQGEPMPLRSPPTNAPERKQLDVQRGTDPGEDGPFSGACTPATREAFYKMIEEVPPDTPLDLVLDGRLWDVRDEDVYRLKTQAQLEALLGGKLEEPADLPEQDRQTALRDRRHLARIRLIDCTALTDAGYEHIAGHADLRLIRVEAPSTLLKQYESAVKRPLGLRCQAEFIAHDEPAPAAGASAFPAGDGGHPAEPPRPALVSLRVAPADGQAGTQSNEEVPDSGGAHTSPVPHTHEQASVSLTADPPQAQPSAGTPQPERTDAHEEASSPEGAPALHTFSPLTRWAMLSFMAGTPPPAIRLVLDAKRWAVDDHDLFALQSNSNNTRVHAIHLINCTSLSGAGLNSLAHLPNLRALSIEGGGMTGAMLEGMIEQFAIQTVGRQTVPDAEGSMKHLCLAACPYTERLGVRIAYLPGLESLELRDMHAVAPIDLSFLDSMSLTSLVLAGTRCDVRTLEAVNTMESLEYWEPGVMADHSDDPVAL